MLSALRLMSLIQDISKKLEELKMLDNTWCYEREDRVGHYDDHNILIDDIRQLNAQKRILLEVLQNE